MISGVTIGGLVSVISVLALAWTAVNDTLVLPYSDVKGHLLACSAENVTAALTNLGNKEAIVTGGKITQTWTGTGPPQERALTPLETDAILTGGKTTRVHLTATLDNVPSGIPPMHKDVQCAYKVRIELIGYREKSSHFEGECPCIPAA